MSYAAVAAQNAPSPSQQPHPDPQLLNTTPPSNLIPDDLAKVNLVAPDFKNNPATLTSQADIPPDPPSPPSFSRDPEKKKKNNSRTHFVEAEGPYIWQVTKHYLFRPGVAGGLIGLVNIGLLSGAARAYYVHPHLRRDTAIISSTFATTIALLTAEGYLAAEYSKSPQGQEEERRAKKEGSLIYRHLHEQILRPGVLGGLVGFVNAAILGTTAYFSYARWDAPSWDRRTVSAVSVGLLTIWGAEGLLLERYRK